MLLFIQRDRGALQGELGGVVLQLERRAARREERVVLLEGSGAVSLGG